MVRTLPTEISNALDNSVVEVFFAVDLLFDSPNEMYLWSGIGEFVDGGITYTGAGNLLQLSDIRESSDIGAYGATLTCSGIPSDLLSLALSEPYQGRVCNVKVGIRAITGISKISSTPPTTLFTAFSGYMDQMNIEEGPETSVISLDVESKLVDLSRPRIRRYTDQSQQSRYSGDLAFEFVTRIQNESLEWGG